ncbi:hypothetical protein FPFC_050660 [Fructobacillus pseudoficulneus]|uniref:Uncharacterized protein n=1 Tax=Fructobacillus pseudoficulneus TaxID=220714 RepID=A0A3F3H9Y9_9LACO|nr:hypothetical protein [Fructobacillus pseudoficulneus]GAP03249.1 hypothetical protein FPFC_050660 [Fructobacillus pseudoficulneus]SEH43011.1 hypothetical protein SAMN05660469_1009 [Fructobacillus pseudoficulneus]
MKKFFAFLVAAVASALVGFGIGTINHPQAQRTSSATSSAKKAVTSANSNQGNDSNNQTTAAQSTASSAKSTSAVTSTAKVTSAQQAIAVLTAGLGNNTDLGYSVLSAAPNDFVIKVVSKSIRAQGGTGTVGIYTVRSNGTYQLQY